MKNNLFLQNYQHLQYGIMYNKLIDLDYASLAWCGHYDSEFFNHAQVDSVISQEQLLTIESELSGLKRKPAVYFENKQELANLVELLTKNGYTKVWEDSWMFHSGRGIDTSDLAQTQRVTNKDELEAFLSTFDNCYQEDDPQNPYGTLGDYLEVARKAWYKNSSSGKIEYFTVFDDSEPVAVATLTNFAGIGYISNVGSLKRVRGKGFGKSASLYAVQKSVDNGNQVHALATEDGHYPNEFYQRIGFETKFTAVGYVKEKK